MYDEAVRCEIDLGYWSILRNMPLITGVKVSRSSVNMAKTESGVFKLPFVKLVGT